MCWCAIKKLLTHSSVKFTVLDRHNYWTIDYTSVCSRSKFIFQLLSTCRLNKVSIVTSVFELRLYYTLRLCVNKALCCHAGIEICLLLLLVKLLKSRWFMSTFSSTAGTLCCLTAGWDPAGRHAHHNSNRRDKSGVTNGLGPILARQDRAVIEDRSE